LIFQHTKTLDNLEQNTAIDVISGLKYVPTSHYVNYTNN